MTVKITPQKLSGKLDAVSSKSDAHRILIAAALADKKTTVHLNAISNDITATIECLSALGAEFDVNNTTITISPVKATKKAILDCSESGSTLRFLMPVSKTLCPDVTLTGSGRLPERPTDDLRQVMSQNGCIFPNGGKFPLQINGMLKSGEYVLPGNVSSQYITGLLFALPVLCGDSIINITSPLQSRAYVDMTLLTLRKFNIIIKEENNSFIIPGNQKFISPGEITVEGDWSNAAFWLCAGALGGDIQVTNLDTDSLQGDKQILNILQDMGAYVTVKDNSCRVTSSGKLRAVNVNAEQIPDLMPIIAVTALAAEGTTKIYNAARLRIKESDRLKTVCEFITALGGNVIEGDDYIDIIGTNKLSGGTVSSQNDHRIAMAASVAAILCQADVTVNGAEAVNKSYPGFYSDYNSLGGKANVINNG